MNNRPVVRNKLYSILFWTNLICLGVVVILLFFPFYTMISERDFLFPLDNVRDVVRETGLSPLPISVWVAPELAPFFACAYLLALSIGVYYFDKRRQGKRPARSAVAYYTFLSLVITWTIVMMAGIIYVMMKGGFVEYTCADGAIEIITKEEIMPFYTPFLMFLFVGHPIWLIGGTKFIRCIAGMGAKETTGETPQTDVDRTGHKRGLAVKLVAAGCAAAMLFLVFFVILSKDAEDVHFISNRMQEVKPSPEQIEAAEQWNIPPRIKIELSEGVHMYFMLIPPGIIENIGQDGGKDGLYDVIEIETPFYMSSTPVTKAQWKPIRDERLWKGRSYAGHGLETPANYVSWWHAIFFCGKLSDQHGARFRLPTEKEWEYASRAGAETRFFFGEDPSLLHEYAWYNSTRKANDGGPQPVARKAPNPWGLFDVYGNVFEWCIDRFVSDDSSTDSEGDVLIVVVRGGHFRSGESTADSVFRGNAHAQLAGPHVGFRVVLEVTDGDVPGVALGQ